MSPPSLLCYSNEVDMYRSLATEYPIQVFIYAARHGHDDLLPGVEKPIGLADYKSIKIPLQLLYAEPPWVIRAFHE
jgi:hypothetical protein